MNLTKLTRSDLERLGRLVAKRESLEKQIADVEDQLRRFEGRTGGIESRMVPRGRTARPAAAAGARVPGLRRAQRRPRGELKEAIIQELRDAGRGGVHIKDIAQKLGLPPGNINVWFQTTGKRISNIKKAAPATYRWQG